VAESQGAMKQGLEPNAVNRVTAAVQPTVTPRGGIQPADESAAWAGAYPQGLAQEDEPAFTAALLAARQAAYADAQARVGERKFGTNEQIRASAASTAIGEAADRRMTDYRAKSAQETQYVNDASVRLAAAASPDEAQSILADIARNTGKSAPRAMEFAVNAAAAKKAEAAGKGDMAAGYSQEYGLTPIEAREVVEGKRFRDPATGLFIPGDKVQREARAALVAASTLAVDVRSAASEFARSGGAFAGVETFDQWKRRVGAAADPLIQKYKSLREQYLAMILKANSGAAFSENEFKLYQSLLPPPEQLRMRDGALDPAAAAAFDALDVAFERKFESGLDPNQLGRVSTNPQDIALLRAAAKAARGQMPLAEFKRGLAGWSAARSKPKAKRGPDGGAALDALTTRALAPATGGR
jgi:hypothetical protein